MTGGVIQRIYTLRFFLNVAATAVTRRWADHGDIKVLSLTRATPVGEVTHAETIALLVYFV